MARPADRFTLGPTRRRMYSSLLRRSIPRGSYLTFERGKEPQAGAIVAAQADGRWRVGHWRPDRIVLSGRKTLRPGDYSEVAPSVGYSFPV